jgi:ANTAR domain-containing protein
MASEDDVITAKVAEITEHRAVIEQAKGMLMLIYGLEADPAFDLLKWRSQKSNVKLRRLAQELIDDFRAVREEVITARLPFDELLLGGPAPAVRGRDAVADPAAN